MRPKRKQSLGQDVFGREKQKGESGSIRKILGGSRSKPGLKQEKIDVSVTLTPSDIKHLDAVQAELEKMDRGRLSRNTLIRVAISLLSAEDF